MQVAGPGGVGDLLREERRALLRGLLDAARARGLVSRPSATRRARRSPAAAAAATAAVEAGGAVGAEQVRAGPPPASNADDGTRPDKTVADARSRQRIAIKRSGEASRLRMLIEPARRLGSRCRWCRSGWRPSSAGGGSS
jgi:predicted lipid-binding transport protein (Tim44 family)